MHHNKKILACIPARSGSLSIPDKNLQKVGGHSILGRSILHAHKSELLDKIVVSTNGQEIKDEALKYEVEVIDRPQEISTATSSTEAAILHALEHLSQRDENFDYVVILQPTSPFRSDGLIDRCIRRIVDEKSDSLVACWKFHNFCFYQIIENGIWHSTFDYADRPMRQQIPIDGWRFFDTGVCYVTKTEWFREHKCRLGGKISVEVVNSLENIQIDEMEDLLLCQSIANGGVQ